MKVIQVNKLYYPHIGGIEKTVYDIASELKEKMDIEILVCNVHKNDVIEYVEDVKVTRAGSLGTYFSMPVSLRFLKLLGKGNADIYHLHLPFPLGVISYLLKKPKGKIVVTWHSDIIKQKRILKLYKPFLMRFLKKVDVILTTSPQMIDNSPFLSKFKDKCKVVPSGIDVTPFINITDKQIEKIQALRKKYGQRIVFFMGRLVYYKGISYLIDAMKDINAKLLIAGTGNLQQELKEKVKEMGIINKVEFLGRLDDEEVPLFYHACDIFVLPSIENSEAFGLVQLEAMACGKPVISTNLPTGVPFVNQHNKTGIIVEPKNSEQLKKAINYLLDNRNIRMQFGECARKRVINKFTKEVMANRIYDIYKKI